MPELAPEELELIDRYLQRFPEEQDIFSLLRRLREAYTGLTQALVARTEERDRWYRSTLAWREITVNRRMERDSARADVERIREILRQHDGLAYCGGRDLGPCGECALCGRHETLNEIETALRTLIKSAGSDR